MRIFSSNQSHKSQFKLFTDVTHTRSQPLVGNACGAASPRGTQSVPDGGKEEEGHFHHFSPPQGRFASHFAEQSHRHSQAGAWERECVTSVI